MQKHLEQVLTAAGLTADEVKALAELPDTTADFKPETHVTPIRAAIETAVKNDPTFYAGLNADNLPKDFVKTVEQQQYGRAATIVRDNMLKTMGWTAKDFESLGDEGKKIEVFTKAFATRVSEGKVTDKELQQKLIQATEELDALKAETPKLAEKYKAEKDQEIGLFKFENGVVGYLATVTGLKAPASFISDKVSQMLRGRYAYEIVGGVPELRDLKNPTLKALEGGKELTLKAAIDKVLVDHDMVAKKGTKEGETGKTEIEGGKTGLKVSGHVNDKMARRLEEDARAAAGKV